MLRKSCTDWNCNAWFFHLTQQIWKRRPSKRWFVLLNRSFNDLYSTVGGCFHSFILLIQRLKIHCCRLSRWTIKAFVSQRWRQFAIIPIQNTIRMHWHISITNHFFKVFSVKSKPEIHWSTQILPTQTRSKRSTTTQIRSHLGECE